MDLPDQIGWREAFASELSVIIKSILLLPTPNVLCQSCEMVCEFGLLVPVPSLFEVELNRKAVEYALQGSIQVTSVALVEVRQRLYYRKPKLDKPQIPPRFLELVSVET